MRYVAFMLPDGSYGKEITALPSEREVCDHLMELKRKTFSIPPHKVMSESEITLLQLKANYNYEIKFASTS